VILHNWPEEHVGAEVLRKIADATQEFVAFDFLGPDNKAPVGDMDRLPLTILDGEQQRRFIRHSYLLVVAGVAKALAALQKLLVQCRGFTESSFIDRRGDSVQVGVERIEKDQPAIAENAGKQFAEGGAEVLSSTIGFSKPAGEFLISENFRGLIRQLFDLRGQLYLADRSAVLTARGRLEALQFP